MSLENISSEPIHPKPKPKGSYKVPGLQEHEEIECTDIFKSVFYSDAGQEKSKSSFTYDKNAQQLLESQLSLLDRKVQFLRSRIFVEQEQVVEQENLEVATEQTQTLQREKLINLHLDVKNKLEKLSISHVERNKAGKIKGVSLVGIYFSIRRLTKSYFATESSIAAELLDHSALGDQEKDQPVKCNIEKIIIGFLEELYNNTNYQK